MRFTILTDHASDWNLGNALDAFLCRAAKPAKGTAKSGGFETLPVRDAPSEVVKLALRATAPIGDGLYGVDLKYAGDRIAVIEVNDNPSIDAGVEDAYLGEDLYRRIMDEFLRRMERKRLGLRG